MIPYTVGKLDPNSLTRGLVKYVPGRGYFRAVSPRSLKRSGLAFDRSMADLFEKNLNASKPSEHPPQVEECLKVQVGTLAVETKPLHGTKRVPQCNYIGSTV